MECISNPTLIAGRKRHQYFKKCTVNNELDIDPQKFPSLKRRRKGGPRKRATESVSMAVTSDMPEDENIMVTSEGVTGIDTTSSSEQTSTVSSSDTSGMNIDIKTKRPPPASVTYTWELEDKDEYMQKLSGGIVPLFNYKLFVLKDFSRVTKRLLHNKFVIVSRNAKLFKEDAHWLYRCSCNPQKEQMVGLLADYLDFTREDFQKSHPPCLHIRVVEEILTLFDRQENVFPEVNRDEHDYYTNFHTKEPSSSILEIFPDHCYCVVEHDQEFSQPVPVLILLQRGKLRCERCKVVNCCHTKEVDKAMEEGEIEMPHYVSRSENLTKCFSQQPIQLFPVAPCVQKALNLCTAERMKNFIPDQDQCLKCGGTMLQMWNTKPLYDKKTTSQVRVCTLSCPNCGESYHVDGMPRAILHMKNFLVCYEILVDFMDLFCHSRTTMWTYYQTIVANHRRCGDQNISLSYNMFRSSWYNFLTLIMDGISDIEELFLCPDCGKSPDIVIMDATSLGHRSWAVPVRVQQKHVKKYSGSEKKVPVLPIVKDKSTRDCLRKFEKGESSLTDVATQIQQTFPELTPVLHTLRQNGHSRCPQAYRALFRTLSSESPACSIMTPNRRTLEIVDAIINGKDIYKNPEYISVFQEELPVFIQCVSSDNSVDSLRQFIPLLQHLRDEVVKFFEVSAEEPEDLASDESLLEKEPYNYYPSMPTLRRRGIYNADRHRYVGHCNKKSKGHPTLSPGIFCIFCQHGICYGFSAMETHESPDVPFTILTTRFATAPSLIVYDNACHLHKYCLRRNPEFFKDTRFLVDRLHWYNHTACGEGYNIKNYLHLSSLNSQAAEQANSSIGKLKSMLSYMNLDHFMKHCKLYLWHLNRRKLEKALRSSL